VKTLSVVNRDESPASCTTVFLILFIDKPADPHFLNGCEILFHAHMIVITVTHVNPFDLSAGVLLTFETEGGIPPGNMIDARTFFKQMRAALISRPAAGTLAAFQMIHIGQVPAANRAVHSAGRDQIF
jgi:hypothetical protein